MQINLPILLLNIWLITWIGVGICLILNLLGVIS